MSPTSTERLLELYLHLANTIVVTHFRACLLDGTQYAAYWYEVLRSTSAPLGTLDLRYNVATQISSI